MFFYLCFVFIRRNGYFLIKIKETKSLYLDYSKRNITYHTKCNLQLLITSIKMLFYTLRVGRTKVEYTFKGLRQIIKRCGKIIRLVHSP